MNNLIKIILLFYLSVLSMYAIALTLSRWHSGDNTTGKVKAKVISLRGEKRGFTIFCKNTIQEHLQFQSRYISYSIGDSIIIDYDKKISYSIKDTTIKSRF